MNTINPMLPRLAGLVLCGGQSARMGSDKGLLLHNDSYWVEEARRKLVTLSIPVWISVRPSQLKTYTSIVSENICIPDSVPLQGPLAGVLSAHQQYPETDWLVLACDLIDMNTAVLEQLVQAYQNRKEYGCFLFEDNGKWEPLCAVYTAMILKKVFYEMNQKSQAQKSMKYVVENSHSCFLTISDTVRPAFKNYNSLKDLKKAKPL